MIGFSLSQQQADRINELFQNPRFTHIVGIRENSTGEVRFCPRKVDWEESSLYWWSSGNMSCDCNRHLVFHEYSDECYKDDIPCGDELYTVVGSWFPDGSEIRDITLLNDI